MINHKIVVGLLVATVESDGSFNKLAAEIKEINLGPSYTISAKELNNYFIVNPIIAEQIYHNKIIFVTGIIKNVSSSWNADLKKEFQVCLYGEGMGNVYCNFSAKSSTEILNFSAGKKVRILGIVQDGREAAVSLTQCSLAKEC